MIAAAILLLDDVSSLVGVHRLGVAAIGVMTLAIMVRASLGHAGQTLRAGPAVSLLFLAVLAAVAARTLAAMADSHIGLALYVAAFAQSRSTSSYQAASKIKNKVRRLQPYYNA